MIAIIQPTKIRIYTNPQGKSIAQVKAETGCDYIINGGLFESLNKPCPLLKVDAKWQTDQPWTAFGYAWDNDSTTPVMTPDTSADNYIYCVDLINPIAGDNYTLTYPADLGGSRQRTAWGILEDGRHVLYCDKAGRTPEQLRDYLRMQFDFNSLLMLDGGGSSQCIFPDGKVSSSRKVQNLICFWISKEDDNMPYTEPTVTLRRGAEGTGVKWLQEKLNLMAFTLTVDGIFGAGTEVAVRQFQSCYGLTVDGAVGLATRSALNAVANIINDTDSTVDSLVSYAMAELCTGEPSGDDKYIKAFNEAIGASLPMTSAWCQIFAWYCCAYFALPVPETASCTVAMNAFKADGRWYDSPQKGDLIFLDWDKTGDADHVGIVASVTPSYITVIEGNSSGSTGDAVRYKTYDRNTTTIRGYGRVCEEPKGNQKFSVIFDNRAAAEKLAAAYGGKVEAI